MPGGAAPGDPNAPEGQPQPGGDDGGIPGLGVPYKDFIPTVPMVQDPTTGEWRNAEPGEFPGVGEGGEGQPSPPAEPSPSSITKDMGMQERLPEEVFDPQPAGETEIASEGSGGTASAYASGGNVTIGDANTSGNVSADGGTAIADASGGDANFRILEPTQQTPQPPPQELPAEPYPPAEPPPVDQYPDPNPPAVPGGGDAPPAEESPPAEQQPPPAYYPDATLDYVDQYPPPEQEAPPAEPYPQQAEPPLPPAGEQGFVEAPAPEVVDPYVEAPAPDTEGFQEVPPPPPDGPLGLSASSSPYGEEAQGAPWPEPVEEPQQEEPPPTDQYDDYAL